MENALKI